MCLEQRLSIITLAVKDLAATRDFYIDRFGWTPLKNEEGIVFFRLNGSLLALFPAGELAKDAGVNDFAPGRMSATLALCLRSEQEVNAAFDALRGKGATIVKEPHKVFWGGYSGYVEDNEQRLWEIAYNPFMTLDAEGNVESV